MCLSYVVAGWELFDNREWLMLKNLDYYTVILQQISTLIFRFKVF